MMLRVKVVTDDNDYSHSYGNYSVLKQTRDDDIESGGCDVSMMMLMFI